MKKFFAVALALVLCCTAFSACGDAEEGAGGVFDKFAGELEQNITLRVLENDTAIEQGYFDALLAAFNEAYAEYGITAVDANMDQYLDLANDGPYGYGPDVLYQANDVLMKNVDGRHITPIPIDMIEGYSDIPEAAWAAYESVIEGQEYTFGVPVNVQAPMFFYRKDLLPENWQTEWDDNQNGIPDMVESWNELYAYSQSVHSADSSKYGYMKSLYDVYFSAGYLFSYGGYVFGNNNTDDTEIGFSAGNAELGARVLRQLASIMTEECVDNTITLSVYSKIASGEYFCTMTTPDVYTLFIREMILQYRAAGMSEAEAKAAAEENLVMTTIPKLPASGDLSEESPELIDFVAMGGVNGYAISSYTKSPKAALAFVNFAASYESAMMRNEYLGIVPARSSAAEEVGGIAELVYENLANGLVIPMPSLSSLAQIWTPGETFFSDVAKDPFRPENEQKFHTLEDFKTGLENMDTQIYEAIHTLK